MIYHEAKQDVWWHARHGLLAINPITSKHLRHGGVFVAMHNDAY